ncbi:MAG TPA: 2-dehydropantoate 2-reductase [Gaiellaceae bacterium]
MATPERPLRHAVLGAGGVGLLVAGVLARAGRDVLLLLRPEALTAFDGTIAVESVVLGAFAAPARAAPRLDEPIDVLWVATKATALDAALELAPPERVRVAVPLLNGVEHVARLRERFQHVVAASISVESERLAPGRVRQTSPFLRVVLAPGGEALAAELREAGLEDVSVGVGEAAVLWSKLAFLAPLALATSAAGGPLGAVLGDTGWRERFERCRAEVCAVAAAEGAPQDAARLEALLEAASPEMRSSMQKDVEAGRGPELDAIGGAVLRAARRHEIAVPATEELVALVEARPRRTIAPGSTSRR